MRLCDILHALLALGQVSNPVDCALIDTTVGDDCFQVRQRCHIMLLGHFVFLDPNFHRPFSHESRVAMICWDVGILEIRGGLKDEI